jgi:hypothetical protein
MSKSFVLVCLSVFVSASVSAQPADQAHQMEAMHEQFQPREGSGTAWLPDETAMYAIHRPAGMWELMWHANVFVQFLSESSGRSGDEGGSINWGMLMARRSAGTGQVGLRGMVSLEPWTTRGCGYPDLLATGEVCDGEAIHDRQHPHDFLMELAAEYGRRLSGSLQWQLYTGLAGEPALGPVAYPHRPSAMPNPLAPIAHHLLDSTHISYGVVTTGVHGDRWKVEASAFNGREPDDERANLDLAALDSFSGRLWFQPSARLALQVSAGHLKEAEAGHDGSGRTDVDRITASATYHRSTAEHLWATTLAWGRNAEADDATSAALIETAFSLRDADTWFGRFEIGSKTGHDLDVAARDEIFTVAKLQGGYTRYLRARGGWKPGFGGELSLALVPRTLDRVYGGRANVGLGVFVTLRPAVMEMMPAGAHRH